MPINMQEEKQSINHNFLEEIKFHWKNSYKLKKSSYSANKFHVRKSRKNFLSSLAIIIFHFIFKKLHFDLLTYKVFLTISYFVFIFRRASLWSQETGFLSSCQENPDITSLSEKQILVSLIRVKLIKTLHIIRSKNSQFEVRLKKLFISFQLFIFHDFHNLKNYHFTNKHLVVCILYPTNLTLIRWSMTLWTQDSLPLFLI